MAMDSVPWANGATQESDSHGASQIHRLTPSFLHADPRPDDFAHAGLRRSIALALNHVGFDNADAVAVESFALATEECTVSHLAMARQCECFPIDALLTCTLSSMQIFNRS